MRVIARASCATWIAVSAALGCNGGTTEPERVLLVTIDTLRADRVGCYGATRAHTPTLDALARDGVRFDAAISPVPLTLPSHATILTGLDPDRHGVRHNGVSTIAPEIPTLAERMQGRGYATAAFVGAFVLDHRFGLARGFDVYDDAIGDRRSGRGLVGYAERRADVVVDAFLGWLERAPDRFFAWVHVYDPHADYDPPAGFSLGFPHPYDGEIAFVDAQLARLLAALDQRFPRDGTLIVVTSDHGDSLGEHGEPTHSYTIYDATQRVPLIASGPGFRGGRVVQDVVRLADVAPTLVAASGGEPLPGADGRDLAAVVRGGAPATPAYSETLATHLDYGWSALFAVRDAQWRYVAAPEPELYDLRADPRERRNVAAANAAVAAERAAWLAARRTQPAAQAGRQTLTAEERAQLAALGYVTESGAASVGDLSGPDPKRHIAVLGALLRASRLSERGRHADAYAELVPFDEKGPAIRIVRATYAIRAGLLDPAERDVEAGLADHPSSVGLTKTLALVKEGRRDWSAARALYERVAAADPTDSSIPTGLGRIAEAQGDTVAAERHYRAALEIWPGASEPSWDLAALLAQQGRLDEARALLAEVGPPMNPLVALRVAAFEADAGDRAAAAARLEAALGDAELPLAMVESAAGILDAGGRVAAAVRLHESALRRDPESWHFQNGVAWGLAQQGRDLDRALALAQAAAVGSREDPGVLDTLAAVHLARREPAEARAAVARALRRAGPDQLFYLYLSDARALRDLGRRREAAAAIERSLAAAWPAGSRARIDAESLASELASATSEPPAPP